MNRTSNGLSTAALVLSIIGILTMCCGGSLIFGSLAILLALLSRGAAKMSGQAKAAFGIGLASVILEVVLIAGIFIYVISDAKFNNTLNDYIQYYQDYYGNSYDDSDSNDYNDQFNNETPNIAADPNEATEL